ncbi:hypothetical protein V6N11_019514 [Hibiscus sabdariffa]|uniref:YTH domain-containing family protein n=1 Tax=Hibiscus sabdariffa TaxID=183260 RepID=A0ABR1ZAV9_9ROSI
MDEELNILVLQNQSDSLSKVTDGQSKHYAIQGSIPNSSGSASALAHQDDFPLDYVVAKFFFIKSYSEDDVHKSIKYNLWSSTPRGNEKLESAFEDAQKTAAGKPSSWPIFLFFSVRQPSASRRRPNYEFPSIPSFETNSLP